MKSLKTILYAFFFGGTFSLLGQLFTLFWITSLGNDSPLLGFGVLSSMGILGAVMYIVGVHQRFASAAGYGAILPLNGFCAALADAYYQSAWETESALAGIKGMLKLFFHVMGIGLGLVAMMAFPAIIATCNVA